MYYKMKAILLLALSAIVLSQSYGFVHGAEDMVKVTTDSSSYESGDMITVSGTVMDYVDADPFKNFDVTLKLIAPNGNIVSVYQEELGSDGSYSISVPVSYTHLTLPTNREV